MFIFQKRWRQIVPLFVLMCEVEIRLRLCPGETLRVGLPHLPGLDQPVVWKDDEPQPRNARLDQDHLGTCLVDRQPEPRQPLDNGGLPLPELALVCQ